MDFGLIFNIALIIGLILLLGYLAKKLYRQSKHLKIHGKKFNAMRVMFGISFILCLISIFVSRDILETIRSILLTVCVGLFILVDDGIGQDSLILLGTVIPFSNVIGYDYVTEKKKFSVIVEYNDTKNVYTQMVDFDLKDEESVKAILKTHISKKYRRMKK